MKRENRGYYTYTIENALSTVKASISFHYSMSRSSWDVLGGQRPYLGRVNTPSHGQKLSIIDHSWKFGAAQYSFEIQRWNKKNMIFPLRYFLLPLSDLHSLANGACVPLPLLIHNVKFCGWNFSISRRPSYIGLGILNEMYGLLWHVQNTIQYQS